MTYDRQDRDRYFSATHVTHTYAGVMADAFLERGWEAVLFNCTPYTSRQEPLPIQDFDGLVFGFPVFADFAPSVINDWLPTLAGDGKPCATFFTYGGRTSGYAHFHTGQLLERTGFQVLFSGEFLGRHSFNVSGWQILPDRPNDADFSVARAYVDLAIERFSQPAPPSFHLQKPFGYSRAIAALRDKPEVTERAPNHPVRVSEPCSMCRDCETGCPTQSFNADTGLSDPGTCIECMHCVYICPDEVIQVDPKVGAAYPDFMGFWHLTDELLDAKRSMILTEPWQAAC